jgi:phage shock protein A
MGLIARVGRLFKADVHEILDSIEDPRAVLRQAMRDMQAQIEKHDRALSAADQAKGRLETVKIEAERTRGESQKKIELCLRSGQEDLARVMLKQRLEAERRTNVLNLQIKEAQDKISRAREVLEAKKAKFKELSEKMAEVQDSAVSGAENQGASAVSVSEAEIEVALLAEKARLADNAPAHQ